MILRILPVVMALAVGACSAPYEPPVPPSQTVTTVAAHEQAEVAKLTTALLALDATVDPEEAERAAQIAYAYTAELKRAYGITDPPLLHNTKVNMGLRPRGLCWHWAEDMERRLLSEGFVTLDMHRMISSPSNPFRIDHSTAVISAKGHNVYDGIVLDPWRLGGTLTWDLVQEDTRYEWRPRAEVLAEKRAKLAN